MFLCKVRGYNLLNPRHMTCSLPLPNYPQAALEYPMAWLPNPHLLGWVIRKNEVGKHARAYVNSYGKTVYH